MTALEAKEVTRPNGRLESFSDTPFNIDAARILMIMQNAGSCAVQGSNLSPELSNMLAADIDCIAPAYGFNSYVLTTDTDTDFEATLSQLDEFTEQNKSNNLIIVNGADYLLGDQPKPRNPYHSRLASKVANYLEHNLGPQVCGIMSGDRLETTEDQTKVLRHFDEQYDFKARIQPDVAVRWLSEQFNLLQSREIAQDLHREDDLTYFSVGARVTDLS